MYKWIDRLRGFRAVVWGGGGALVVWMLLPSPVPSAHFSESPAVVSAQQQVVSEAQSKVEELAALRAENEQIKKHLLALQNQLTDLATAQPAQQDQDEPQELVFEQAGDIAAGAPVAEAEFALLEEQFYADPLSADESAAMQRDLHVIEIRLEQFTAASTYIQHQECRSNGCRVEFVHEQEVPALLPALIASAQHSRVTLSRGLEDGRQITVALYQN